MTSQLERLAAQLGAPSKMITAVVHPVDGASIGAACQAAARGLIEPVLFGPKARILQAAQAAGADITSFAIEDAPHSHAAAQMACLAAASGQVAAVMKGALHSDELMGAAVSRSRGLRTDRRMSHVFLIDAAGYPKPFLLTDAALNIAPDLVTKRDIVQNAIDCARALGVSLPKVAVLSAVETVNPRLQSTIDAAALCKMADRGQIVGGLIDGPLAFDNAISAKAAAAKGIVSKVAGDPDILIAPDLETGNMLAKQMTFMSAAQSCGLVLGARVPIILTSRADGEESRVASCILAQLVARSSPSKYVP